MKACKPITKESSQKFTDGRSGKEGYSFLRPVPTLSFQNKPWRVWGWRAGRGWEVCCYIGERTSRACTRALTLTHTHAMAEIKQEAAGMEPNRREPADLATPSPACWMAGSGRGTGFHAESP